MVMMNLLFKRILLVYMAVALVATPVELLAANKKSQKRISISQKSFSNKQRVSNRYKKSSHRVSVRLRNALAAQRAIEESYDGSGVLQLASSKALVIHQNTGEIIYAKNTG